MRAARPDLAFSSDFIVGFPGEDEHDFQNTLDLIEEIQFVGAYSFKYSPRPGTPASIKEDIVSEDVKNERLYRLQELLNKQLILLRLMEIGVSVNSLQMMQLKFVLKKL